MSLIREPEGKLASIRRIYRKHGKKAMLIEKQYNLSWLLRWRTHVNFASVNGSVDVLINNGEMYLVANNIEAVRILTEERHAELHLCEYFWYEPEMRNKLILEITGNDYITDGECEEELRQLRSVLTDDEAAEFKELCGDAAQVMQQTCMLLQKGSTEFTIASLLAQKCLEREIEPVILLVASDERINKYRHPLPTASTIEEYVMLVMGVRRLGQYACLTRFLSFSEPSDELKRRRDAVFRLNAMLISDTRSGNSTAGLFNKLVDGYGKEGFPDEWKLHHQGGLGGYNSREYKASFTVDVPVRAGHVYVWNPSITGFKAEDTMLVENEGNTILTATEELPATDVEYEGKLVRQADIFVRKQMYKACIK